MSDEKGKFLGGLSSTATAVEGVAIGKVNSGPSSFLNKAFEESLANSVEPPKTDWKRIGVDKDEKEKILNSLRANPKSNFFSKEFKWELKEFLEPFKYLESSEKYNGQFISTIINKEEDLGKYFEVDKLKRGINGMYFAKYMIVSLYDISATPNSLIESKHIYIGLNFLTKLGALEFDCAGSLDGPVSSMQKLAIIEYLDSMEIIYDDNHKDLKAI